MDDTIQIRTFRPTGADYDAVAGLHAGVPKEERLDFEPPTAEALRAFDAVFARRSHVLERRVAEVAATGRVVACAQWFHTPWSHRPDRFWLGVRCDPAYRRHGVGGRLYADAMADLARRGAAELRAMARETMPDIVALVERHGFRELFRSWDFVLDVARAEAGEGGSAAGIEIATLLEEQARDPGWLAKLRALFMEVNRDVPLPTHVDPELPPEVLADWLERAPESLPEACFLARDGDRYVGLAVMHRSEEEPGTLYHHLTGVDRACRGRGVGKALKHRAVAFARKHGYTRIRTAVESNNPAMLALNEKLGFERTGGVILFQRRLSG